MTTRKEQIDKAFDRHRQQKKEKVAMDQRVGRNYSEYAHKPTYTFADLKAFIDLLTPEQLNQQAQLLSPGGSISDSIMLEPIIGAGTVKELCSDDDGNNVQMTHSALDFQHHPEQVVLLSDYCPFSEEGDSSYTLADDEDGEPIMIGNKTGRPKPLFERKRCEPSTKASRTPGMDSTYEAPDEVLTQMQEELCDKSKTGLTPEEANKLIGIQAELYRRIYHLSTREEMAAKRAEEDKIIEKHLNEEVDEQ